MTVLSLTYFSTAVDAFDDDQLQELLAESRAHNHQAGLTGMLLYAGGHFVQTLEGPAEVVDRTFAAIEADPRHRSVFVTLREQVDDRVFEDWSMGFELVSPEDAAELPGFSDYLDGRGAPPESSQRLGRAGVFHRVFRDKMR